MLIRAIFACLLPVLASAEKRIVTAVYVRHPDAVALEQITIDETKQAIVGANLQFRQLGQRIQIRGPLRIETDPFPDVIGISDNERREKLSKLNQWGRRLKGRKAHAVHFITAPLVSGDKRYIAGVSWVCTNKTRISGSVSNLKTGRLLEAATTIAHEVGHTFGAEHVDEEPNIMHSAANSLLPASFRWSHWTSGDIRFCQSVVR